MIATRTFVIKFLGEDIECLTPQDAAALQLASDILSDLASSDLTFDERVDVTAALFRYGRYRAARELRLVKLPRAAAT